MPRSRMLLSVIGGPGGCLPFIQDSGRRGLARSRVQWSSKEFLSHGFISSFIVSKGTLANCGPRA